MVDLPTKNGDFPDMLVYQRVVSGAKSTGQPG
jgi:hypothetical protein